MEGTVTARKPYQESEASKVLYSLSTISGRIERLQEEAEAGEKNGMKEGRQKGSRKRAFLRGDGESGE